MGAVLTAEVLAEVGGLQRFPTADRFAAAAGLAPVLRQSVKARSVHRSAGGNKALKNVLYRSAFCAIKHDPISKAYYERKRARTAGCGTPRRPSRVHSAVGTDPGHVDRSTTRWTPRVSGRPKASVTARRSSAWPGAVSMSCTPF